MFRTLLLSLTLMTPLALHAQTGDPLTGFANDDMTMNAAMDEAQRTLKLFLQNVTDAEGFGSQSASVKVAFPTTEGPEIIWVGPFVWDGDEMAGLLSNQPNYITGYNEGDPIAFTIDMVRDWSYRATDGTLWGNYTTRVMLPQLDAAMAAQLSSVLSKNPIPEEW